MVGTSKILTVSYGTFSCTLEGFDDSFNTMKAIAEYFRGLAADDRYFGAEPPTPDAEMLARIAEKEISRRVDARMEKDGIVLRPAMLTDTTAQPDTAPDPDETPAPEAEAPAPTQDDIAQDDRTQAQADQQAAEKVAAEKAAQAEAQAEAEARAEADAQAKAEADAQHAKEEQARRAALEEAEAAKLAAEAEMAAAKAAAEAERAEAEARRAREAEEAAAPVAAAALEQPQTDAPAAADAPQDGDADDDSVAAKLRRIRQFVSPADADPTNDLTEDFLPAGAAPDISDLAKAAPEETGAEETDPKDAGQTAPADDQTPDMISRVLARQAAQTPQPDSAPQPDAAAQDAATAAAEAPAPQDDTTAEAPRQPRARVVRMKKADFEKVMAQRAAEAAAETTAETAPETTAAPADDALNLGLLDGADDLDEYLEDSDFTQSDLGEDLAANLEEIAKETGAQEARDHDADDQAPTPAADTDEDAPAPAPDQTAATTPDAHAFLAEDDNVSDDALNRLMSEADAQLQEPEGNRRRNAIAQLKAAVAAKQAARQVGEPDDDGQDVENAFRNDLSEAVRPDSAPRPQAGVRPRPVVLNTARTERPRPAPLKLVASQRVDLPAGTGTDRAAPTNGPVMPRRVAAGAATAPQTGADSFAEFADTMGARELPELLEAAAAYTSFVEGAGEFSRPQILRRVRAVATTDFNREDGLRSFAELLRAGKFTKIRNGRFQVADDSRFNPERQAG